MNIASFLKGTKLLSGLSDGEISAIAAMTRIIEVPARHVLFEEGRTCDGFYALFSGRVKIFKQNESGKEQILHMAYPGETFAEAALFAGGRFPASAETMEESTLVFMPAGPFLERLHEDPKLCIELLSGVTTWLRKLVDLVEDLSLRDVQARLSAFLLRECRKRGFEPVAGASIPLRMRKADLARHLGTAGETLSRTFNKMSAEGILRVARDEVLILKPEELVRS